MMDGLHGDAALGRKPALSNTIGHRVVAFGPIAVALVGIAIMAALGGRDQATLIGATTTPPRRCVWSNCGGACRHRHHGGPGGT